MLPILRVYLCSRADWQALGKGIFRELVNGHEDTQEIWAENSKNLGMLYV